MYFIWNMGKKIIVDLVIFINKGFEVIEVMFFFDKGCDDIEVLIYL